MKKFLVITTSIFGFWPCRVFLARADDELEAGQGPEAMGVAAGDDANTRFSTLNQINAANVKKLQVAWTFSTGVLRGHEGARW